MHGFRMRLTRSGLACRLALTCGLMACAGSAAAAAADLAPEPADMPVFDVPRLAHVVIDGQADDWGEQGFRVEALAAADGATRDAADLDARFRLGWDARGLLVLVRVRDDVPVEGETSNTLWQGDALELFLADRRGGTQLVQAVIAPGLDPQHLGLRCAYYDHRQDEALRRTPVSANASRIRTPDGWQAEVLLPWENIGLQPQAGVELGFQLYVDDLDATNERPFSLVWYPRPAPFADARRLHRLRLAECASPPVVAAGRAAYDGMKCLRVSALAAAGFTGQTVTALADGVQVAQGPLLDDGGRELAVLKVPIPPAGVCWSNVDVRLDGRTIDRPALPNVAAVRARASRTMPYLFHPFCFTGSRFPNGDFEDPLEAANTFGPFSVQVTFYDAAFQPVRRAAAPGRYGAVVEIRPEHGEVVRRYLTLCRLPAKPDWRDLKLPAVTLPPQCGVPAAVAREQVGVIGEAFAEWVADATGRTPASAVVFAWLMETAAGTAPATERTGPWSCESRWMHELRRSTGRLVPLEYVVHVPQAVSNNPAFRCPAILFLHGSGERAVPLATLTQQAIMQYARAHTNFPCLIIAPQCPPDAWWETPALDDLYAEVLRRYPIDPARFYLSGLSMGGYGSWALAMEHPDRFAAVAPICGGGDAHDVARIKDLPVWDFHGALDPTVPICNSDELITALRQAGGRVRYTVYADGVHDVWSAAYARDDLYAWLLQQVRGAPSEPVTTARGALPTEKLATPARVARP